MRTARSRATRGPRRTAGLVALAAALVLAGCAHDLEVTPEGGSSRAYDVNDLGWVVAQRTLADGATQAFLQRPGDDVVVLDPLPGFPSATARAVNDRGVVVGVASRSGADGLTTTRAVRWDADGTVHPLADRGGASAAIDLNDAGTIVGNASTAPTVGPLGAATPVVWEGGVGAAVPLALLPSGLSDFAWVTAINSAGTIVGFQTTTLEDGHALRWSGPAHTLTDLLPQLQWVYPLALGINDAGAVVGSIQSPGSIDPISSLNSGWLLPPGAATPVSMPGLAGGRGAIARAAAPDGTVVGEAIANGQAHAVRWDPATGSVTDLGTLGGLDSAAFAVNADGLVAGWAQDEDGRRRAATFD